MVPGGRGGGGCYIEDDHMVPGGGGGGEGGAILRMIIWYRGVVWVNYSVTALHLSFSPLMGLAPIAEWSRQRQRFIMALMAGPSRREIWPYLASISSRCVGGGGGAQNNEGNYNSKYFIAIP